MNWILYNIKEITSDRKNIVLIVLSETLTNIAMIPFISLLTVVVLSLLAVAAGLFISALMLGKRLDMSDYLEKDEIRYLHNGETFHG